MRSNPKQALDLSNNQVDIVDSEDNPFQGRSIPRTAHEVPAAGRDLPRTPLGAKDKVQNKKQTGTIFKSYTRLFQKEYLL